MEIRYLESTTKSQLRKALLVMWYTSVRICCPFTFIMQSSISSVLAETMSNFVTDVKRLKNCDFKFSSVSQVQLVTQTAIY